MKWGWQRIDASNWRFNARWTVTKHWATDRWYVVRDGKDLLEDHASADAAIRRAEKAEGEKTRLRDAAGMAVEALDVFARAYRVAVEPFGNQIDHADGAHHWMPRGWPSVQDYKNTQVAIAALKEAL